MGRSAVAAVISCGCSFAGDLGSAIDGPAVSDGAADDGPVAADGDARSDAHADASFACPPGYALRTAGSCYRIVTAALIWQDAEVDCELAGAHLAVVDDAEENTFITGNRWIGLTELVTAGTFEWVTGAPLGYTGWASGQPATGGAACTEARPDGWHDDNCPETKAYACEYDGIPADPAQF